MPVPDDLTALIEASRQRMQAYTQAVANGADINEWHAAMQRELKRAHIQIAELGKGGRDVMTQSDWGRVGARLREEYRYLRDFGNGLAEGGLSEAQIMARSQLYSNHLQMSYWDANRAASGESGAREERRIINPGETCPDCEGYAAQGWVPIGTLPPPGVGSVCRSNCNCSMEYR